MGLKEFTGFQMLDAAYLMWQSTCEHYDIYHNLSSEYSLIDTGRTDCNRSNRIKQIPIFSLKKIYGRKICTSKNIWKSLSYQWIKPLRSYKFGAKASTSCVKNNKVSIRQGNCLQSSLNLSSVSVIQYGVTS